MKRGSKILRMAAQASSQPRICRHSSPAISATKCPAGLSLMLSAFPQKVVFHRDPHSLAFASLLTSTIASSSPPILSCLCPFLKPKFLNLTLKQRPRPSPSPTLLALLVWVISPPIPFGQARMPPSSVMELDLQKKKKRKRHKSPGLICCCRFARSRDKMPSPVYTARELSVASLGLQFQPLGHSQQRPLTRTGAAACKLDIPEDSAFADDTPSNRGDYLDCGVQTDDAMETARTSRLEDLHRYPSMEGLVSEILSDESGEGSCSLLAPSDQPCPELPNSMGWQTPRDRPPTGRLATFQSGRRKMPDLSSVTVSSPASLCPSSDAERQQQQLALWGSSSTWRLAVSALPQSVSGLVWLAYAWIASSVAFFLEWLF